MLVFLGKYICVWCGVRKPVLKNAGYFSKAQHAHTWNDETWYLEKSITSTRNELHSSYIYETNRKEMNAWKDGFT